MTNNFWKNYKFKDYLDVKNKEISGYQKELVYQQCVQNVI